MSAQKPLLRPSPSTIKATRVALGLSGAEAAAVARVADRDWWRYESPTGTRIPLPTWELFLIKTGAAPLVVYKKEPKS